MNDEYVEITGSIVHQTDNAWLIDDGSEEQTWVPRSQIDEDNVESVSCGKNGEEIFAIPITEWFAKKEGLI